MSDPVQKVVPLFSDAPPSELRQPNDELIGQLRKLLADAETGHLQGTAAACSFDNSTVQTLMSTNGNHFAMSHAIGALHFRFHKRMHDEAKDV